MNYELYNYELYNYELAGASSRFRTRKTATLQILLNHAEQKQRSCNIFVAVCVSARLENTDISLSSVATTSFLTAN
ncbi:MAG: hypothetical protein LBH32_05670 [Dysgonamonadaceae bacterium]|jgi:hypothetical protein|nr:hypothetical protein [Dysgonamonadaceae bacterium]